MQITVCDICGKDAEFIAVLMALGEQSCKGDLCPGCHSGFLDFFGPILDRLTPLQPAPTVRPARKALSPGQVAPAALLEAPRATGQLGQAEEDYFHGFKAHDVDGIRRDPAWDTRTRAPWAMRRQDRGQWVQFPGMAVWLRGRQDLQQGTLSMSSLPTRRAYVADRRSGRFMPDPEIFMYPATPLVF